MQKRLLLVVAYLCYFLSISNAQIQYSSAEEQLDTMLSKLNFDSITSMNSVKNRDAKSRISCEMQPTGLQH